MLADWRPVPAGVRREPHGDLARRLDRINAARDLGETGALWRAHLAAARERAPGSAVSHPARPPA